MRRNMFLRGSMRAATAAALALGLLAVLIILPLPHGPQPAGNRRPQPNGAFWPAVCIANTCPSPTAIAPARLANYGRYPVVSPSISLTTVVTTGLGGQSIGDPEPSRSSTISPPA